MRINFGGSPDSDVKRLPRLVKGSSQKFVQQDASPTPDLSGGAPLVRLELTGENSARYGSSLAHCAPPTAWNNLLYASKQFFPAIIISRWWGIRKSIPPFLIRS